MIKCLIVEDEIAGQTILAKKLATFYPECSIEGVYDNKQDAFDHIRSKEVDLLFLDVQIKGGTGIEIVESFKEPDFETIFITAHKEYAMEALNNNASYYLLKPIHDREFKKGMDLVLERIKRKKIIPTIFVPHKNMQVPVNISHILYLKSDGAYAHIITKQEHYLSSKSLGHYEQLLAQSGFIRCHHSFLVNSKHVVQLEKGRSGTLILSNGDTIPISQRRLNDFMSLFQG
ncbi:response regulator transcription factor [Crocinitomicaceae bacterium CZZ-1]|uniref:Response regulator transcription factor n=1 Tax=Taishania pollutisoli TaxID=2766479 RepID=A0A8J6PCL5_9FLAO|nr:LytTR family DNA-binding domain-containing protein [Taishania pollutisoli]MBC9812733.1 response regulator transcription factor [Taishania pollutisoli]MBX2949111.1 response regulator transcription factor [Crocinitomicaceae bacterium]NGF75959.1 response regulator transcription factor [Fluviicola sp. SGL-29]